MSKCYYIYGASGHSKVIIEIIEKAGNTVMGLFDDDANKNNLFDYKVTNNRSLFQLADVEWIIGIGNNKIRKEISENYKLPYGVVIDANATITKRIELGKGTVVMPNATINSSTTVGKHVIINTNSSVDHDCNLGDYVHISPNATLCGGVTVGEGSHIGAGAVIIPGIKIGNWVRIGAGAVIIKDVSDFTTVVGNPGKILNRKE